MKTLFSYLALPALLLTAGIAQAQSVSIYSKVAPNFAQAIRIHIDADKERVNYEVCDFGLSRRVLVEEALHQATCNKINERPLTFAEWSMVNRKVGEVVQSHAKANAPSRRMKGVSAAGLASVTAIAGLTAAALLYPGPYSQALERTPLFLKNLGKLLPLKLTVFAALTGLASVTAYREYQQMATEEGDVRDLSSQLDRAPRTYSPKPVEASPDDFFVLKLALVQTLTDIVHQPPPQVQTHSPYTRPR